MSGFGSIFSGIAGLFSNPYGDIAKLQQNLNQLKDLQEKRKLYLMLGQSESAAAGNGLMASGSAADAIRANVAQGHMERAMLNLQGAIEYKGIKAQEQAQMFDSIGNIIGGAGDLIFGK